MIPHKVHNTSYKLTICNNEIPEGVRFCGYCREKLTPLEEE
jgi:hypothetical protein